MATKKLQGITIEIDGNTTGLTNSLKDVNKTIYEVNGELREIQKLLKFDPGNSELLVQKQELLARAIKDTTSKLETLKEAKKQADERIANGSEEGASEGYRELVREIAKTEQNLANLTKQSDETGKAIKDIGKNAQDAGKQTSIFADVLKAELLSEAIKKGISEIADGMKKLAVSMVNIGKDAINSYAEFEQLEGGVKKLFGEESAKEVQKFAQSAYKEAGISANDYMKQVTNFSAGLIKSLDGDTSKAAEVANMAIKDMADNANTFGTDITSIQNAYQGFAKQNYTMLDNLKLGFAGSKSGMQDLLKQAEKLTGKKFNINNLNEVYEAIHVVQEDLKITGTTSMEAADTIEGSLSTMKASWDNLMTSLASGEGIGDSITNLVDSIGNVTKNIVPILESVVVNIASTLPTIIKKIFPELSKSALKIINTIIDACISMLPDIIKLGLDLIISLIQGIAQALPKLIPAIVDGIILIVDTIVDNIDLIIEAGIDIILALTLGLIDAIPKLLEKIPTIISKLVKELTKPEMLEKLVVAAIQLMLALAGGIIKALPELLSQVPRVIKEVKNNFVKTIKETDWKQLGKNILDGILNGLVNFGTVVKDTVKKVGKKITNEIKDFFGIHSPSKLMKDEVGRYLADGIGVGIEDEIPNVVRDVNSAMSDLTNSVQASVNPTINPTANSNPLIIQIENFNNARQQDVQELAEELEFYRKMTATAKGGN